ncbi:MAG: phage tail protein [Janthinobacterium lividum]
MATLVLGTLGRALGGPLGGIAGTFLGASLDRGIFGSGPPREGARLSNLAVQSAAYGEPLPRIYGRMRVAGNVVWTSGIRETLARTGGGKRGPATNNYSYSASFAVVLAARVVVRIDRIWADGKLLRAADGGLIYPAVIRTYTGSEDQPADPLIAAAEGIDQAPAYRGRVVVVFDDLPLADYGNRIPNLTFELVADDGDISVAAVAGDLAAVADAPLAVAGRFPQLQGFVAGQGGTARQALGQLLDFADLPLTDDGAQLYLRDAAAAPTDLAAIDLGASENDVPVAARSDVRAAAGTIPDALAVGFYDPARDYQLGLQRAVRRSPPLRTEQRDLPVALDAATAKRLAEDLLRRAATARTTATIALPWRYAGVRAGDLVRTDDDARAWRVRHWSLVGPTVELEVEPVASATGGTLVADPGRPFDAGDLPNGPTVLHVLDLPALPGPSSDTPRLWLAAAGASAGWRRAEVLVSADGGASYSSAATIVGPAIIGSATTPLAPGNCDRWDRRSTIDVQLLDEAMWLESRSEASVLAGANLALVGDEIVQFAVATALGDRRFRLSTLLRGRRGTEGAAPGHGAAERFVMLDTGRMAPFDLTPEALGGALVFKAVGAGDDPASVPALEVRLAGRSLQPPGPVMVRVVRSVAGFDIGWIRRSRGGFGWPDGVDAPLGEEREAYRLTIALDGRPVRDLVIAEPAWTYAAAAFAADGGSGATVITVAVAQLGAFVASDAAGLTATVDEL